MGRAVVHGAAGTAEQPADDGLTEPSLRSILGRGLPGFLREGFLPLGAFYAGLRLSGPVTGIAAGTAVSALIYVHERRLGRDGLLVRLSLAFVAVQTAIGLLSHSMTAYLAAPVLLNAAWGAVFLASAAIRRPLAGALACAWYPFPPEFRRTAAFKRVYGLESIVWGLYLLARSAIRLDFLFRDGVGSYLAVVFVTGTPLTLGLLAWSIWYALRKLAVDDGPGEPAATSATG
jgi:hypothetical protein